MVETPSQWQHMMGLLTDPLELRSMAIEDVMELALLYNRYDFQTGVKLCDDVLYEKVPFDATTPMFCQRKHNPSDFSRCVRAIVLSEKINLRMTFHRGRMWLHHILVDLAFGQEDGCPLTVNHLKLLIPTILIDDKLSRSIFAGSQLEIDDRDLTEWHDVLLKKHRIIEHLNGGGEELRVGLRDFLLINGRPYDIANPLFPELFIAMNQIEHSADFAPTIVPLVNVVFPNDVASRHPAAGSYKAVRSDSVSSYRQRNGRPGDARFRLLKCPALRVWKLFQDDSLFFLCERSEFDHVPPKSGWIAVRGIPSVVPTLEY